MKLTIAFLLIASTIQDYKVCTADFHAVVDDIFDLIQTFEKDPFHPDSQPMKHFLESLEKLLFDCFKKEVDLHRYEKCVDDILPVFPQIQKLIEDIKTGETS